MATRTVLDDAVCKVPRTGSWYPCLGRGSDGEMSWKSKEVNDVFRVGAKKTVGSSAVGQDENMSCKTKEASDIITAVTVVHKSKIFG